MNPTIDISISSPTMNCNDIIHLLNVSCKITPNITKICKNNVCRFEQGCNLTITEECDIGKIWSTISRNADVSCAHLNEHGKYKGCILNYLRKSNCPSS